MTVKVHVERVKEDVEGSGRLFRGPWRIRVGPLRVMVAKKFQRRKVV